MSYAHLPPYLVKHFSNLWPVFKSCCFLITEFWGFFICSGNKFFIRCVVCKYLFPVCGLSFSLLNSVPPKIFCQNFDPDCVEYIDTFGKIPVLPVSTVEFHGHGISLHLFQFPCLSLSKVLCFSVQSSRKSYVRLISKDFMWDFSYSNRILETYYISQLSVACL